MFGIMLTCRRNFYRLEMKFYWKVFYVHELNNNTEKTKQSKTNCIHTSFCTSTELSCY